jgi:hypothetical protein
MEFRGSLTFQTNQKDVFDKLRENGVMSRYVDTLLFAISLGIAYDEAKEVTGEEEISVPLNTLIGLEQSFDFLFKTAILTCSVGSVSITDQDRIKLAFDDSYEIKGFNRVGFLLSFAPYGMKKIVYASESHPLTTIDNFVEIVEKTLHRYDNVVSDDDILDEHVL